MTEQQAIERTREVIRVRDVDPAPRRRGGLFFNAGINFGFGR